MRQVPELKNTKYLIVGNGRLANHFKRYLSLLNIPFNQFNRNSAISFKKILPGYSHILLLINDDEIIKFVESNKKYVSNEVIWVHCSGLISTASAESAHPLASFTDHLFEPEFYNRIPFVIEKGRKPFNEILPGLPNPYFEIERSEKELYHAMCSLAGNFSTILWIAFQDYITGHLNFSEEMMHPYLESITRNIQFADDPLTGPLKRKDSVTTGKHIKSLEDSPLKGIYKAFINYYTDERVK